jgi:type II secretory pathway component GspD/PulD (secretin)
MKMLKWAAVSVSFFATSLSADTVRLVNAPVDAVTAYFSQLTGNAYILDFSSPQMVSILKEVSGSENIHALFVDLIESLGGEVKQTATKSFKISQKVAESVEIQDIIMEPVSPEIALQRIYLGNKISKDGVGDLIRTVPILNSLTVISDGSNLDAVLISGEVTSIGILKKLIGTLDAVKKPEKPNLDLAAGLSSNDKGQLSETGNSTLEVVDLNFADAEELVATLAPLLSSDANTAAISVSAHQSANQVILSGSSKALRQALSVIALMDRAPRQVYVDAIIAEVSEDSALKLGLQFSVNEGSFSSSVVTGLTGNNIGSLAGDSFLTGAAGGVIAIGAGANKIADIGLMLNALKGDTDNRILATPSLMTTENKESTILIGQNVPFITGQYTNQGGDSAAPFQTIKREDLGTILKLKPKIGKNGDIIMEIWQEISRIDQSAVGLSDVVTVKRQISTVVSAKEGETIAIGGLRVEQEEIGVSKVPFFGDLPFLGPLFTQESSKTVSRNLAIFLRPTIVSNQIQRAKVVKAWRADLGEKLFNYGGNKLRSRDPIPIGKRLEIGSLRPKVRTVGEN